MAQTSLVSVYSSQAASPLRRDSARQHSVASLFDVHIVVGRSLHYGDKYFAARFAFEAPNSFADKTTIPARL